jgi:Ca-activated chloride channel family protein
VSALKAFQSFSKLMVKIVIVAMVLVTPIEIKAENPILTRVDLELLIAIDVSNSVSDSEYALQVRGLAMALQDAQVQMAIERAGRYGIAVAVVQWAGDRQQIIALDWTRITNPEETEWLASTILRMPRYFYGGDTRIGKAVLFGASELSRNQFISRRQVIDVSGDGGAETIGITRFARDRTIAQGITINGLAIENEVLDLNYFYRDNVIGGYGAFVIRVGNYYDFADAMRRKLIREIDSRPVVLLSK